MRWMYDSGALWVLLFGASFLFRFLRGRTARRERSTYQIPEPTPEKSYAFYRPVRDRIISKDQWKNQPVELLAALWTVNEIRSEELPPLAADLLEVGYDGKYLRRLAGETVAATRADVAELADKAFAQLGVPEPMDVAAANRLITRSLAEKVLNHQLEPAKAVLDISWLYDWSLENPAKEFVMLNYAYEDLYEHDSSAQDGELDEQARAVCLGFIQANPPKKDISPHPDN
jgi:hypothetical protein